MMVVIRVLALSLFLIRPVFAVDLTLEWDPPREYDDGSVLSEVGGYRLYYGTSPGNYPVSLALGSTNHYTVIGLNPKISHYFSLKAISREGIESDLSQELLVDPEIVEFDPSDIDGDGIVNSIDSDDDGDGLSDVFEAENGTSAQVADTDQDGVLDGQEFSDGTNPLDGGDFKLRLRETTCAEWNGFLGGMWNFFEHSNSSLKPVNVTTTLFSFEGIPTGTKSFTLAPGGQYDVPVHEIEGFTVNSYGKVCSTQDGLPGDLDGRMVYYKPDESGGYQFGFPMPMTNGKFGRQWIPFNTFHPGNLNFLSANWIQITNLGDVDATGKLVFFDQGGNEIATEAMSIAAGRRIDTSAHKFGASIVGLVQWVPGGNSLNIPFILRNVRYLYDNPGEVNSFNSAVQLEGLKGTSEELVVPLNTVDRSSIVEIVNVSESVVEVEIDIPAPGNFNQIITLAPKASFHLIADEIIGQGREGVALVRSSDPSSLLAVAMFYARAADGNIDYVYAIPGSTNFSSKVRGNFNTFIDQNSWLTFANTSTSEVSFFFDLDGQSFSRVVGPRSSFTEYLNGYVGVNKNGVVRVESPQKEGTHAWLLRSRGRDFLIPTSLR